MKNLTVYRPLEIMLIAFIKLHTFGVFFIIVVFIISAQEFFTEIWKCIYLNGDITNWRIIMSCMTVPCYGQIQQMTNGWIVFLFFLENRI